MVKEIYSRRSIRRFLATPVDKGVIEQIVAAGIKAPSAKNRQPWRFVVVCGDAKARMLDAMQCGVAKEECGRGILGNSARHLAATRHTLRIMAQAPVIVFVLNVLGHSLYEDMSVEQKVYDRANMESIGACIQNMLLEAQGLGLGSLWICDVFFAYDDLSAWLGCEGEMVAAVAIGYPDQQPKARPRRSLDEKVEWRLE